MTDAATSKRVLPARERRESAAKRRGSSPLTSPKITISPTKKPTPSKPGPKSSSAAKYVKKRLVAEATPPRRPSTPIVYEEPLPTKIVDFKPLPTSRLPQPEHFSTKDYQSLAESAVLAASLLRSRMKWLCDGIFERYWTKPSKKKGAPEVASNNPEQKSMHRLGTCSITIEPHIFDATVWTVRDPQGPVPVHHRHPNQHPQPAPPTPQTFQNYYPSGPSPQPMQSLQARPAFPPPPPSQPLPARLELGEHGPQVVKQESTASSTSPPTDSLDTKSSVEGPYRPPTAGPSAPPQSPATPLNTQPASLFAPSAPSFAPRGPAPPPSPAKPNTDPVIQMLATRAATDPELKALMKVVASSKASQEQLKLFQSHIDELNGIIKRQEEDKAARGRDMQLKQGASITSNPCPPGQINSSKDEYTSSRPNAAENPPNASTAQPSSRSAITAYGLSAPQYTTAYTPNTPSQASVAPARATATKVGPLGPPIPYTPYPPPPPRPEPRVKHIVIEFTSPASSTQAASQDRWLFPEYAVLDTPISGRGLEMVCSFFVERKGSQVCMSLEREGLQTEPTAGEKWKASEEYYQAVTMTLKAPQHRTLETIARAAKPLHEVQKYMKEIMEKKKRAPLEYLVMRLPKQKTSADGGNIVMVDGSGVMWKEDHGGFVDSGVEVGSGDEDDELPDVMGI